METHIHLTKHSEASDFIFVHHVCRDELKSFGNHADLGN